MHHRVGLYVVGIGFNASFAVYFDLQLRNVVKENGLLSWRTFSECSSLSAFSRCVQLRPTIRNNSLVVALHYERHHFNVGIARLADVYAIQIVASMRRFVNNTVQRCTTDNDIVIKTVKVTG